MLSTSNPLEQIMHRPDTWRGRPAFTQQVRPLANSANYKLCEGLPTGFRSLDQLLSQGGWPSATCIEVLSEGAGMGAIGLFLPAMEQLSTQHRWQAFIAPPCIPYAPLLAARGVDTNQVLLVHPKSRHDLLWSTEQALRNSTCSVVFSWLGNNNYRHNELHKLQLAAASSSTLAVLFRGSAAAHQTAPAGLRLQMPAYRQVRILKQHGGPRGIDVHLTPTDDIPGQPQLWELPDETFFPQTGAARAG